MNSYPKYEFLLQSFGLQSLKVVLYKSKLQDYIEVNSGIPDSYLGTPVFDTIYFDPDDINLRIDTVLLDVAMTKNIVKTAIQGMSGTVKEYISDGDYMINIKGNIFSETDEYPTLDVATLLEICKRNENVRVTSNFLLQLGINDIVIESYSFRQDNFINTQAFEINAISDKPVELILSSDL